MASNWLDDKWWIQKAYQEWRVPLPVNSNWWILMQDDHGLPDKLRNSVPLQGEFTDGQIKRAAKLTHRLIDFKLKLERLVTHLTRGAVGTAPAAIALPPRRHPPGSWRHGRGTSTAYTMSALLDPQPRNFARHFASWSV